MDSISDSLIPKENGREIDSVLHYKSVDKLAAEIYRVTVAESNIAYYLNVHLALSHAISNQSIVFKEEYVNEQRKYGGMGRRGVSMPEWLITEREILR